jgi:GLPGLI family protein
MRTIFFALFIFFVNTIVAQQANEYKADYLITYTSTINTGDSISKKLVPFEAQLFVAANSSLYIIGAAPQNIGGTKPVKRDSAGMVYKNMNDKYIVFKSGNMFVKGLFTDTLDNFPWQLTEETKQIDSLLCTKATTKFRGRNYEAWFCPDIAIPNGPFKFGGLPGLIIEIYDTEGFIYQRMTSMAVSDVSYKGYVNKYPAFNVYKKKVISALGDVLAKMKNANGDSNCLGCQDAGSKIVVNELENIFN